MSRVARFFLSGLVIGREAAEGEMDNMRDGKYSDYFDGLRDAYLTDPVFRGDTAYDRHAQARLYREFVEEAISNHKLNLSPSNLTLASAFSHVVQALLIRLESRMYGLDAVKMDDLPSEPGDTQVFQVPDPTRPPKMPINWYHHLISDVSLLFIRLSCRGCVECRRAGIVCNVSSLFRRLGLYLLDRVKYRDLKVVTVDRKVTVSRKLVHRIMCPHSGVSPNPEHAVFLLETSRSPDPAREWLHRAIAEAVRPYADAVIASSPEGGPSLNHAIDHYRCAQEVSLKVAKILKYYERFSRGRS